MMQFKLVILFSDNKFIFIEVDDRIKDFATLNNQLIINPTSELAYKKLYDYLI